jgi:branched-subunit amino acid aminotransferase/4-amino-4-deoxychorismate lyase
MVETFEEDGGRIRRLEPAASLTVASARLPQGAYTTLRTYGGDGVVRLGQHAKRLEDSAAAPGALPEERLRRAVAATLQATRHAESRLRVTFAPPRLFVSVEPFVPPPPELYEHGVACATVAVHRNQPHAKDTRFISEAGRAYAALPAGVHEGLMVAADGSILEGLSSNFFAIRRGKVQTEEARSLPGVTRSMVLEAAADVLPVLPVAVRVQQLPEAAECFLTSVSRGILPVARIDEIPIGSGRPGPMTHRLMRRFDEMIAKETIRVLA